MSREEINVLGRKYELWKVLHPGMERPENCCMICIEKSGVDCLSIRLGLAAVGSGGEDKYTLQLVRHQDVSGFCIEWARYV